MNKYIVLLPNNQYATLKTEEDLMPGRLAKIKVDKEDVEAVIIQKGYRSLMKDPFVIVDGQIRAAIMDEFPEPHMDK
jgi:hypothetical protein